MVPFYRPSELELLATDLLAFIDIRELLLTFPPLTYLSGISLAGMLVVISSFDAGALLFWVCDNC